jgi:hypothetical protein
MMADFNVFKILIFYSYYVSFAWIYLFISIESYIILRFIWLNCDAKYVYMLKLIIKYNSLDILESKVT